MRPKKSMASKSGLHSERNKAHIAEVNIQVLVSDWEGHRLLDTGDGLKLEEIGGVRMVRSEPKACRGPNGRKPSRCMKKAVAKAAGSSTAIAPATGKRS